MPSEEAAKDPEDPRRCQHTQNVELPLRGQRLRNTVGARSR